MNHGSALTWENQGYFLSYCVFREVAEKRSWLYLFGGIESLISSLQLHSTDEVI